MESNYVTGHIDNEARFYIDLLQLCAGLLFGDNDYLTEPVDQMFGSSQADETDLLFCGIEQALTFLDEFYNRGEFMSGDILRHLAFVRRQMYWTEKSWE